LGVALPYIPWSEAEWEWDKSLPSIFSEREYFDPETNQKKPNPLYSAKSPVSNNDLGWTTRKIGYVTFTQPDRDLQYALFGSRNWADFATYDGNPESIPLESLHDRFHGYIGGDMAYPTKAAWDPIFWFHHCEVDRQFQTWIEYYGQYIIIDESQKKLSIGELFPDTNEYKPYVKHTIFETFNATNYGYKYNKLVKREPTRKLGKMADCNFFIVTEPAKMTSSNYWVHYFVKSYESKDKFNEHTPINGNQHYAGSICSFGVEKDDTKGHSGETNEVRKVISVSDNPIIQQHMDRVRVIAVAVDSNGNKIDLPDDDIGLLRAEVKAKIG